MNAMVKGSDGKYYEAEAGYSGKAPRMYNVTERDSLFSYRTSSSLGGIEVYQYDGKEMPETLTIPSEINGKTVVSIGESFVSLKSGIKKVIIPDTVKNIGNSAFNTCYDLEELNLPKSLETIGDFALINSTKLTRITAPDGCAFTVKQGAVFDKALTTLYTAPQTSELELPQTLKTIMPYAFYYNNNIKKIAVPSGVTEIGEGTFGNCDSLEWIILPESITKIDNFAFANNKVKEIVLPGSAALSEYTFYYASNDITVYCQDTAAVKTILENDNITNGKAVSASSRIKGDSDKDGEISVSDALLIQQKLAGWDVNISLISSDVDGDNELTVSDALLIQQKLAGWSVTLK